MNYISNTTNANTEEDELVKSFILQQECIKKMKSNIQIENKKLTDINTKIKAILVSRPNKSMKVSTLGNIENTGSILLSSANRREYLSKLTLEGLLEKFFIDKFAERQTLSDINIIAKEASSFVWNNRALIEQTVVRLSIPREKKRKARAVQLEREIQNL
jgi:hypothetical protein